MRKQGLGLRPVLHREFEDQGPLASAAALIASDGQAYRTFRSATCGTSSGTRLSGVAADAVVQRAMRHTSPETKRRYQLGMTDQVRQAVEKANEKAYGRKRILRIMTFDPMRK